MKNNSRTLVILILILVMQLALRLPFLEEPLERDEGMYGYMAQRILAGELPYRDVFDHKPPVVYYIYAGIIKFFGSSLASIRFSTAIYGLFTTLSIFGAGCLVLGGTGGLLAAFLYALFSGGPLIQGASSNTEAFMVLPLVLALGCFLAGNIREDQGKSGKIKGWLIFLSGLLSGLAVMMKQVAVFNFLVLLGFALLTPPSSADTKDAPFSQREKETTLSLWERVRVIRGSGEGFWILIFGFLVFPLLFTLYFWAQGALPDFVNCVFTVNYAYLKVSPAPSFFLDPRYGLSIIWDLIKQENGVLWLLSLGALILILIKERSAKLLLLAFWGIFSFLGVAVGTLFFGHYFIQVIPALCLLSGYAVVKISGEASSTGKVIITVLLAFVMLLNIIYQYPFYTRLNPFQISEIKDGTKTFGIAYGVALELSRNLAKNDAIFVWAAEPEVYFYLGKKAPSRYAYYFNWMRTFVAPEKILKAVELKKPRFIIWTSYTPASPELEKWTRRNYDLKQTYLNWKLLERKTRDFSRGKR